MGYPKAATLFAQFSFQLELVNIAYHRMAVGKDVEAGIITRIAFTYYNKSTYLYSYYSSVMYNLIRRF
jgi:hypothetical protein